MDQPATTLTTPAARPTLPGPRAYEPPHLGGKQAVERVTLFSFACTPGDPGCGIGHP